MLGEAADDLVFPDVRWFSRASIGFSSRHGLGRRIQRCCGGLEEAIRTGREGVLQQAQGLALEFEVGRALVFEERRPLGCRPLGGTVDQLAEPAVAIRVVRKS